MFFLEKIRKVLRENEKSFEQMRKFWGIGKKFLMKKGGKRNFFEENDRKGEESYQTNEDRGKCCGQSKKVRKCGKLLG